MKKVLSYTTYCLHISYYLYVKHLFGTSKAFPKGLKFVMGFDLKCIDNLNVELLENSAIHMV